MNRKKRLLGIGLTLMLGGSLAVVPRSPAQENTADASRRKIRTNATPEYPQLAKEMHVSGKVKIEATISSDGRVTSTKVIGGSPLLVGSALEALKRRRYEPAAKETIEVVEFDFVGHE
jgi:TonB family protein